MQALLTLQFEDPGLVLDLRLSAGMLANHRALTQASAVESMLPDMLFECEAHRQAGYLSLSFVPINHCVHGCKGDDGLSAGESASCAADLKYGVRGWGETHAQLQDELR